jgi:hypothetical protein
VIQVGKKLSIKYSKVFTWRSTEPRQGSACGSLRNRPNQLFENKKTEAYKNNQ